MANHLTLRSGNPVLSTETFQGISSINSENVMTINGTVNKTAFSLFLLLLAGSFSFSPNYTWLMLPGFIGGFIVAIITSFKKEWAPFTVPLYAVLKGLALGSISYIYNIQFEGIVSQAILLTLGILFSLLFAYKSKIIAPTENFKLGIFAATGGIFIVYLISFVMSFFGTGLPVLDPTNSSLFSIGFSLFVVIIASLNLVLDFDFIEEGSEKGMPKYMEWYGAFGLLVTLVWLYLEILRLLSKLRSR
ncbi:MAG: hypothetical protein CMP49_06215 [Flavobacteriales bacterium]|nr:hypothetical protein [Flavobacteriales bacterium]|tara:strand:- start:2733 stop:3473 length:741 start_codon:yes stop_codon:yes gene_type:complete